MSNYSYKHFDLGSTCQVHTLSALPADKRRQRKQRMKSCTNPKSGWMHNRKEITNTFANRTPIVLPAAQLLYQLSYPSVPLSRLYKTFESYIFILSPCMLLSYILFKNPTHALCFKIHIKTQSLFKTLECQRLLCHPTCFGHTLDHLQGMFLVQCCFPPCCIVTILLGYVAVSSVI